MAAVTTVTRRGIISARNVTVRSTCQHDKPKFCLTNRSRHPGGTHTTFFVYTAFNHISTRVSSQRFSCMVIKLYRFFDFEPILQLFCVTFPISPSRVSVNDRAAFDKIKFLSLFRCPRDRMTVNVRLAVSLVSRADRHDRFTCSAPSD